MGIVNRVAGILAPAVAVSNRGTGRKVVARRERALGSAMKALPVRAAMVRLLIVDDSALMRRELATLFEETGGYELRCARNGREAIAENMAFRPHVVVLDIDMPEMDGLSALAEMLAQRPVPVVMLSSLTEPGALASFDALTLGAVDYVATPGITPTPPLDGIRDELISKVGTAVNARIDVPCIPACSTRLRPKPLSMPAMKRGEPGVVVIGVSTGGPRTLAEVLPALPASFPWPVLVAQHMPGTFTRAFAQRLNELCALRVVEVASPMPIEAGTVYTGRGGADLVVISRAGMPMAVPRPESPNQRCHPSVERLARSVLEHWAPHQVIGVMLTGMGHDGVEAFHQLFQRGGLTIAEAEETAIVFGTPAELIRRGGASQVLPAPRIADQLIAWTRSH